ncbi:OLC1v1004704C1 [Oldenlandia corymbosa var. corymbosa]|uniref:Transcription repressor n=1 Tax=Oldenlandia corymbosa var. corymbosa TaxID=529605 RepID=A0AAV1DCW3_OLDCO|nr:OLC1v1004704C1 [Oldenlandia corymbosa var. corymbosa]
MPSTTIKMLKNIFTSHGGCGCGRPKPKEVFQPKSKSKPEPKPDVEAKTSYHHPCHFSSSSSWERGVGTYSIDNDDDQTSTSHSFNNVSTDTTTSTKCSERGHQINHDPNSCSVAEPAFGTGGQFPKFGDSVAVLKDSDDPYQDFRQSMLQMILEKEIYTKDDLQELLNCFLELNSSSHHKVIVQAFMDIWNGVIRLKEAQNAQESS